MATIRPFHAVMPAAEYVSRVAALPYDVYNRAEAYVEAKRDRLSFLNIDRPETQFPKDQDMYAPEVYRKASALLEEECSEGILREEEEACFYLYELVMNGRSQTGIVCCASIDDYLSGVILKHENTREEKLQDRIRHVDVCGYQTGPIFLAFRSDPVIAGIIRAVRAREPLFAFVSEDGITHRGWRIADPDTKTALQEAFGNVGHLYIADGHHRAESAVRAGLMRRERHPGWTGQEEFNFFLSVAFPEEELMIMDYNRYVKVPAGMTDDELFAALGRICSMKKCTMEDAPQRKGTFQIYYGGQWYLAEFLPEMLREDPVEGLDVSILQDRILAPVLGIADPKTDERITFVGGIRGPEELKRLADAEGGIAFRMYPTSIGELMAVADSGKLMPPKSTWFEPKLRSGLFLHRIGE